MDEKMENSPSTNFQPQQEERKPTLAETMEKLNEKISKLGNQVKNVDFQIGQLVSSSYEELNIKEEEEDPREEQDEEEEEEELNDEEREFYKEDPNNENDEDDKIIDEKEEEESPLVDLSNIEKQNQEEANDELKSEMSISIPLTSSICTPLDIYASIDFILPLESFDYRKELKEILGVLKQSGRKLKKMLRNYVRKKWSIGSANSGVLPAPGVQELNVTRLLTLSEKAVAVAHAVSLDNDYSPDVEAGAYIQIGLPFPFVASLQDFSYEAVEKM
ncbi:hypothetical protein ACS0TY_014659 [Phlomoides rotata]